uniref:Uncharacterized protein n=1 Tax=Anguilla anguilla TaxID=7936 RepID=A0A0E9XYM5_ANGAN
MGLVTWGQHWRGGTGCWRTEHPPHTGGVAFEQWRVEPLLVAGVSGLNRGVEGNFTVVSVRTLCSSVTHCHP